LIGPDDHAKIISQSPENEAWAICPRADGAVGFDDAADAGAKNQMKSENDEQDDAGEDAPGWWNFLSEKEKGNGENEQSSEGGFLGAEGEKPEEAEGEEAGNGGG